AGRAVLARRGPRETYVPVRSRLVPGGAQGDPLALARAYRDVLDCDEWYVADLDALAGGAVQRALLEGLAGLRGRLLVDAAVTTPERARELFAAGRRVWSWGSRLCRRSTRSPPVSGRSDRAAAPSRWTWRAAGRSREPF